MLQLLFNIKKYHDTFSIVIFTLDPCILLAVNVALISPAHMPQIVTNRA